MNSDNPSGADNQQERPVIVQWIVGFVDGEGCFSVPIFKNSTCSIGWQCQPEFAVVQGEKSANVLYMYILKRYFGCGHINRNSRHDNHREGLYKYNVRAIDDLTG